MMTEIFINSCYTLCLNNKIDLKRSKALYRDILDIINFKLKEDHSIPMSAKIKVEFLKKFIEIYFDKNSIDYAIDNLVTTPKYSDLKDFIFFKYNEDIDEKRLLDIINQVRSKKGIAMVIRDGNRLQKILDTINDESYESTDEIYENFESLIVDLYSNFKECRRFAANNTNNDIVFGRDSINPLLDDIIKFHDRTKKTPTGFEYLDSHNVFNGGFEPSYLYIIGGGSSSGKSTLMNNMMIRGATFDGYYGELKEKTKLFIYITLENFTFQALQRMYCPLYDVTAENMIRESKNNGNNLNDKFKADILKNNSQIIPKYFPSQSKSVIDISVILDDILEEYGNDCIVAGLYIDYLDLLKGNSKTDLYRIMLGDITQDLKNLAVEYNIPVITATQLGRGSYRINNSYELNLDQVSESIKKVEHADNIILLARDMTDNNIIHGKIGKNRSGASNIPIDFKVDFSYYKFIDCKKTKPPTNKKNVETMGPLPLEVPDISDNKNVFGLPQEMLL